MLPFQRERERESGGREPTFCSFPGIASLITNMRIHRIAGGFKPLSHVNVRLQNNVLREFSVALEFYNVVSLYKLTMSKSMWKG